MGVFGDILARILANSERRVSLARIARRADMDYAYLHTLTKGYRGEKAVFPSPRMVSRVIEAMTEAGVSVSPQDQASLFDAAAQLPSGFKVVAVSDRSPTAEMAIASRFSFVTRMLSPKENHHA